MCRKLLFLISFILLVTVVGDALAGQIYYDWTDVNGIVNSPRHDWRDDLNWNSRGSGAPPKPGTAPGSAQGDPDYLIHYVQVQWDQYGSSHGSIGNDGPHVWTNVGTIGHFKPGAGTNQPKPSHALFQDGGALYVSSLGTCTDKGQLIIAQSTGGSGTLEMTGGFLFHTGQCQLARRGKGTSAYTGAGLIKLWHDDVNDPSGGDPCLCNVTSRSGAGTGDVYKLGGANNGTGEATLRLYAGQHVTTGIDIYLGESYIDITEGEAIWGPSRLVAPFTTMEQYVLNRASTYCDGNPGAANHFMIECYNGYGTLDYEYPAAGWPAGYIRVFCIPPQPNCAHHPSPKNNGTDVTKYTKKCPEATPAVAKVLTKLKWGDPQTGREGGYNVYFGEDWDDVNDGTGTFVGHVDVNEFSPTLHLSKTYYWRIEATDVSHAVKCDGNVWKFSMAHCLCIDDFETYPSTGAITNPPWSSGGDGGPNLLVGTPYYDVHTGTQSMNLYYFDSSFYYSEARLTTTQIKDWTVGGDATNLSLWYRAPLSAEVITVRLTDGVAGTQVVNLNANLDNCWHEAVVAYASFAPVVMTNVSRMDIRVGDGIDNSNVGDYVKIDDIGLCEPRCIPRGRLDGLPHSGPAGDLDDDCDVDNLDVRIMAAAWLVNNDHDPNLRACHGNDIDLAGPNEPNVTFISDPEKGNVIELNGICNYLPLNSAALHDFHDKTISVWSKRLETGVENERTGYIFRGGGSFNRVYLNYSNGSALFRLKDAAEPGINAGVIPPDEWHHYAAVVREVGCDGAMLTNGEFYIDGQLIGTSANQPWITDHTGLSGSRIGCDSTTSMRENPLNQSFGHERLTDFRIYDYALDVNEIRYLNCDANEPAPDDTKLIMHYKFDETSGDTLEDSAADGSAVLTVADLVAPAERTADVAAQINGAGVVTGPSNPDAYNNGQWYYYPNTEWYNIWFYNDPFVQKNWKLVKISLVVQPLNASNSIDILINASTPAWSALANTRPPLPADCPDLATENLYIARNWPVYSGVNLPVQLSKAHHIVKVIKILDYNPEWISVDIRGSNVQLLRGRIWHKCMPDIVNIRDYAVLAGDWLETDSTP